MDELQHLSFKIHQEEKERREWMQELISASARMLGTALLRR